MSETLTLEHPPLEGWFKEGDDDAPELDECCFRLPNGDIFRAEDVNVDYFYDHDPAQRRVEDSYFCLDKRLSYSRDTSIWFLRESMDKSQKKFGMDVIDLFEPISDDEIDWEYARIKILEHSDVDPFDPEAVIAFCDEMKMKGLTWRDVALDGLNENCPSWDDFYYWFIRDRDDDNMDPWVRDNPCYGVGWDYVTTNHGDTCVFFRPNEDVKLDWVVLDVENTFERTPIYCRITINGDEFYIDENVEDVYDIEPCHIEDVLRDVHGFNKESIEAIMEQVPRYPR